MVGRSVDFEGSETPQRNLYLVRRHSGRWGAGGPRRPPRQPPDAGLADEVGRQALRCIRSSACLNVCPVYERTGWHAYGSVIRLFVIARGSRGRDTNVSLTWETGLGPQDP